MSSAVNNVGELATARQILNYIMAPNNGNIAFPFMDRIDAQSLGLYKYCEIIRFPMWLKKMDEKLNLGKYPGIREFVCDFRLILVNCFHYNGVVSRMGKIADKLELLFEQKLQLLPPDVRSKTTLQASLGCSSAQEELADSGLLRRRSSTRLFGSMGDSQTSHPVRALMEELEHAVPHEHIISNGGTTAASILYEGLPPGTPSLPVTNENSISLLIARLTHWQRKQHEEELIASWEDWWAGPECDTARRVLAELRKSAEFLEVYQLLWLVGPFLGLDDALAAASGLYHDRNCYRLENDVLSQPAFVLPQTGYSLASSPQRCLTLTELELGLSAAPQASLVVATCVSNLLNTAKEREVVMAAVTYLVDNNNNHTREQESTYNAEQIGADDEGGGETTRMAATRRIQSSHVSTVRSLSTPPYEMWERRLAARLAFWYEEMPLENRLEDPVKMERRFGVPQSFFDICGNFTSPLENKHFHELTTHQQVHILRALVSSVLLVTGRYGFADNLRHSLDKSPHSDWAATRPTHLGVDPFSGITYLHFPEMMRTEVPRILQYRYPSDPATSTDPPPPTSLSIEASELEVIYLPGPVVRLPTWIDTQLGSVIRQHLIGLIDDEVAQLRVRGDGRDDKKAAKKELDRAECLTRMVEAYRPVIPHQGSQKKKKQKNSTTKALLAPAVKTAEFGAAGFAFLDCNKAGCGAVPLCVTYSRQAGGGNPKGIRAVDSCASIMTESVRSVDGGGNDSEAAAGGTPGDPNFYQEEDSDSVLSPISVKMEGEDEGGGGGGHHAVAYVEKAEDEEDVGTNRHSGGENSGGKDVDGGFSSSTTPCRQSEGGDDDSPNLPEGRNVSSNGFKREEDVDKEKAAIVDDNDEKANGKTIETTENSDCDAKIKQDVPEFAERVGPDPQLAFDNVVYDLESFNAFLRQISCRITRGKALLCELKIAASAVCEIGNVSTMQPIIDKISEVLGDAVARTISSDEKLAAALVGRPEVVINEKEEQVSDKPTKGGGKRRKRFVLSSRPKRIRRSVKISPHDKEDDEASLNHETPAGHILRLHTEALGGLEALYSQLLGLEEEAKAAEPERVVAQRLSGLRLRKDIEAWEAVKKPRRRPSSVKVKTHPPTPPPASMDSLSSTMAEGPKSPAKLPLPPYRTSALATPYLNGAQLSPVIVRQVPRAVPPSPTSTTTLANQLPPTPQSPTRRIFRFYDTLFTEDALPVRLEPNGSMTFLPLDSVPLGHRQMASQMIDRFRAKSATLTASAGAASTVVRPAAP